MSVDLALLKEFCRVDGADSDVLLAHLSASAVAQVGEYLRRDMAVDFPDAWPAPCQSAVMLLVSQMYDNRDAAADAGAAVMPANVRALLAPYRVFA